MKKSSEFSIKKRVDYFELLDKSTSQMKINYNTNSEENSASNAKVNINNNTAVFESETVRKRKAEINAIKAELYQLITTGLSRIDVVDDTFTKKRREELINSKKFLEDEVGTKPSSFSIFKTLIS
jgi:transglutaminase/protease-like cytokinesis protein 3